MTYAKVIAEAKHKIDLLGCGITNIRFKKAATGGRILQVPGATSGEKADSLAEKLKAVLGDRVAKITRPTKCASLRILGLDDSVSTGEVITAIAEQGSCSVESVKTSEIRRSLRGTGSVLVKCPVNAAKKLSDDGRLKIGSISATVKLLPGLHGVTDVSILGMYELNVWLILTVVKSVINAENEGTRLLNVLLHQSALLHRSG